MGCLAKLIAGLNIQLRQEGLTHIGPLTAGGHYVTAHQIEVHRNKAPHRHAGSGGYGVVEITCCRWRRRHPEHPDLVDRLTDTVEVVAALLVGMVIAGCTDHRLFPGFGRHQLAAQRNIGQHEVGSRQIAAAQVLVIVRLPGHPFDIQLERFTGLLEHRTTGIPCRTGPLGRRDAEPDRAADEQIRARHHQTCRVAAAIVAGIEPHLARIRVIHILQRGFAQLIEIEIHGGRSPRRGGNGRLINPYLAAKEIGRRHVVITPERDSFSLLLKTRHAQLARVVLPDRRHHHLLWFVGQGIQHIEQEAAVGKAEGTGGGAQGTAARPAKRLAKRLGGGNRTTHPHPHGARQIVAQLQFGGAVAEIHGRCVAAVAHPAVGYPAIAAVFKRRQGGAHRVREQLAAAGVGAGPDDEGFRVAGQGLAGVIELEVIDLGAHRIEVEGANPDVVDLVGVDRIPGRAGQ
ncbi:hypothetical protein D3C72_658480 [compost metagenome]